jgi:hypothetical protein
MASVLHYTLSEKKNYPKSLCCTFYILKEGHQHVYLVAPTSITILDTYLCGKELFNLLHLCYSAAYVVLHCDQGLYCLDSLFLMDC